MRALGNKDGPRVLAFFAENTAWVTPEGTFTGHQELRSYLNWWFDPSQDIKITESGNGINRQPTQSSPHGRTVERFIELTGNSKRRWHYFGVRSSFHL
jgi:hypothetical protein